MPGESLARPAAGTGRSAGDNDRCVVDRLCNNFVTIWPNESVNDSCDSMSNGRKRVITKETIMIKKTIVILACGALISPLAFAQPRPKQDGQTTAATEQPVTVTGDAHHRDRGRVGGQLPAGQDTRHPPGPFKHTR